MKWQLTHHLGKNPKHLILISKAKKSHCFPAPKSKTSNSNMLINQHIFDNVQQQQQQRSLSPKTMGLSMDPQQTKWGSWRYKLEE